MIISLLVSWICMGVRCQKDVAFTYNFNDKVDIYPAKKNYSIGDTIMLQYSNPLKQFFDTKKSQNIRADSSKINFSYIYFPIYNALPDSSGTYNRYINADSSAFLDQTACSNDSTGLHFKIYIIPERTGIYAISVIQQSYVQTCSYYMGTGYLASLNFTFNVADCNKDIYLSLPKDSIKSYLQDDIDKKVLYVLKVQ